MEKFVNVRKLIGGKNPTLLKWLPGFIIRYIERIVHQDDINEFMANHKEANSYEFCKAVMEKFNVKLDISGIENVPRPPEGIIFASNHPLGGFDALAIITSLKEIRPDIKFIVNDLLLSVRNLKDSFIGVNKVGKNAAASLHKVDEQFRSDFATFIFPAGLVSRREKGVIKDLVWKKTFVTKAKKYQKPIVPVYIEGKLTNRFYRLANFRKALGIKLNIEMFYLADEFYKQQNTRMKITIGKPIPAVTFDSTKSDMEWAQWTKEEVYKLRK
ncbi:1-acyl-sn-glycerol-3-phosphate acyltransferase [Roseivirga sp.]|uniref:1-acyl-sn-glycerol-3-phosphate acyltransferase n=1 Tax=Roseivirga sp. TaxID=1964215 RepID=UPI003B8BE88B